MLKHIFFIVAGTFSYHLLEARPNFKVLIPNGNNVPHPCLGSLVWSSVGHEVAQGGGALNAFGRDFNSAGKRWTKILCQQDSDGDGKTNGQELGDPSCVWAGAPSRPAVTNVSQLSHPGVCEPLDSPYCQTNNAFLLKIDACARIINSPTTLPYQTTLVPTTWAPTTLAQTTLAATTIAKTTLAPTTKSPSILSQTTLAPTTKSPTTRAPTTRAPTTLAPTTRVPTTQRISRPLSLTNTSDWCPSVRNQDVRTLNLNFSKTRVPSNESSFYCQTFRVPDDNEYQVIAWEPIIDTTDMFYQVTLFICDADGEQRLAKSQTNYSQPNVCEASPSECTIISFAWTYGQGKRCYGDDVGMPMGRNAYRTVLLQVHYFNPNQLGNVGDSSGMRLYYTNKTRPNAGALLSVGQMDILIPPNTKSTKVSGRAFYGNDRCSRQNLAPYNRYYLSSAMVSMNQLANYAKLVIRKPNGRNLTVVDQEVIQNRPVMLTWNNRTEAPVLEPGDDLEIECSYDSTNRSQYTMSGAEIYDEMCLAFIEIYPRPQNKSYQALYSIDDMNDCLFLGNQYGPPRIHQCNDALRFSAELWRISTSSAENEIFYQSCYSDEYPAKVCTRECYLFLQRHNFLENPCMQGSVFRFYVGYLFPTTPAVVFRVQSQTDLCLFLKELPPQNNVSNTTTVNSLVGPPIPRKGGLASTITGSTRLIIIAIVLLLFLMA